MQQSESFHAIEGLGVDLGGSLVLNAMQAGTGDALLLLHGGHGGLVHWSANIEDLATDHQVLAPDLPGFGASIDPGRCFSPAEHATVLGHWLDSLGIERVHVAGFSFGALVGIELALARPQRVQALVLVNPPGVGPRSAEALALPERMSALAKQQGHRAGIEGTLRQLMLSRPELVTPELVDRMTLAAQQTRHVTRAISRGSNSLPLLQQLRVPACALIGERDPFHSNDLAGRRQAIDAALGTGATRIVPAAAHWLQYDQPAVFAAALRQFFQQQQETT